MAPETPKLRRVPSNCEGEDEITTDKVDMTMMSQSVAEEDQGK